MALDSVHREPLPPFTCSDWDTGPVRLRRTLGALAVLIALAPTPAFAADTTACTIADPRLEEISGLAVSGSSFLVINDGNDSDEVLSIYVLGPDCEVRRIITDTGFDPLDPEDLLVTADGAIWVADFGDNDKQRPTIAVNVIAPRSSTGIRYRMTFPDGPHDAEALLVQPDGTAVVITKEISGVSGVYTSVMPLFGPASTVALRKAGTVTIRTTDTQGGPDIGTFATVLVTGAAMSTDRRHVVLRTYTDAYEWDVTDGDLVSALVNDVPRRTPLPGEQQGESISYTTDGNQFVTVSEGTNAPIRIWDPVPRPAPSPSKTSGPADNTTRGNGLALPAWTFGAAGVIGVALAGAGILALVSDRRRKRER